MLNLTAQLFLKQLDLLWVLLVCKASRPQRGSRGRWSGALGACSSAEPARGSGGDTAAAMGLLTVLVPLKGAPSLGCEADFGLQKGSQNPP